MYGAYMLGQSLVYAPSFNSAKACGARILAVINREPKIITKPGIKDRKDWVSQPSVPKATVFLSTYYSGTISRARSENTDRY